MTFKLPETDVICLYGIPTLSLQKQLISWLSSSEERYVVILEEEEVLLETIQAKPHLRFLYCNSQSEEAMKQVCWKLVFLQFSYVEIPFLESHKRSLSQAALEKMQWCEQEIHLIASDYEDRGLCRLKNFMTNTPYLKRAKEASNLWGKFEKIPAIICGAGPSLEENAHVLSDLQTEALIFAGGSALSALSLLGIYPHIAAAIDPHPLSKRYFEHAYFELPFFFQSRVNSSFLNQMQGDLLWVPGNPHDFFETTSFNGGWNVATFLIQVALSLGCDPIILVGVDLEMVNGKSYAMGLEDKKGIKPDWACAKKWIETCIKEEKTLITKDLKKIQKKEQMDLRGKLHSILEQISSSTLPFISSEQIKQECLLISSHIKKMLGILESLFPASPEKHPEYALLQFEIEQTETYHHFLSSLWQVWKQVFARKIPPEIPSAYGIELNQWLFMQGVCDDAAKIRI